MHVCMRCLQCMNPIKFSRFYLFIDYAFKASYFIFFKDPANNCLPYKYQQVHFQITFNQRY